MIEKEEWKKYRKGNVLLPLRFLPETEPLTDEELGRLMRAWMRYCATGVRQPPSGRESLLYERFCLQADLSRSFYEEARNRQSEKGRKAARARWDAARPEAGEAAR